MASSMPGNALSTSCIIAFPILLNAPTATTQRVQFCVAQREKWSSVCFDKKTPKVSWTSAKGSVRYTDT